MKRPVLCLYGIDQSPGRHCSPPGIEVTIDIHAQKITDQASLDRQVMLRFWRPQPRRLPFPAF